MANEYPEDIVALLFIEKYPELREIIKEFLETVPHIKTVITFKNPEAGSIPCYVLPTNIYVNRIVHKTLDRAYNHSMPIVTFKYYYTWFENNDYVFTELVVTKPRPPDVKYIAINKEDYEKYLLYDAD